MRGILKVVLGGALAASISGCGGDEPASVQVGDAAPTFSLVAARSGGARVSSQSLRGKVTVLNFWSTTCSVCLKESEELNRVHDSGKAVVVGIAVGDAAEHVRQFVEAKNIKYTTLVGDEDVFSRFDGYSVPYTLVLDRSLTVRRKVYGRISAEELTQIIDSIDGALASAAPNGVGPVSAR